VYPTGGMSLEQELSRREAEIMGAHRGAQFASRGSATVSQRRARALSAIYTFQDKFAGATRPLRSVLFVAKNGSRFVEYRFTYPASEEPMAGKGVSQFTRNFEWP